MTLIEKKLFSFFLGNRNALHRIGARGNVTKINIKFLCLLLLPICPFASEPQRDKLSPKAVKLAQTLY